MCSSQKSIKRNWEYYTFQKDMTKIGFWTESTHAHGYIGKTIYRSLSILSRMNRNAPAKKWKFSSYIKNKSFQLHFSSVATKMQQSVASRTLLLFRSMRVIAATSCNGNHHYVGNCIETWNTFVCARECVCKKTSFTTFIWP